MNEINTDDLLYGDPVDPLEGLLDNFVVKEDCPHKFSAGTGGHPNDCPLTDCPGVVDKEAIDSLLDGLLEVQVPAQKKIKRIWP